MMTQFLAQDLNNPSSSAAHAMAAMIAMRRATPRQALNWVRRHRHRRAALGAVATALACLRSGGFLAVQRVDGYSQYDWNQYALLPARLTPEQELAWHPVQPGAVLRRGESVVSVRYTETGKRGPTARTSDGSVVSLSLLLEEWELLPLSSAA